MSERLGFDVERNMKHLKEIVNKDDSLTLSSRFVKYLIEQDERVVELERKVRVDSELFDMQVKQNKRYHNLLESLSNTHNIASEIMREQPDKKIIDANDLLQYILRKINDELEREDNE